MHRNLRIALFLLAGSSAGAALAGCKVSSCTETTADGGTSSSDSCFKVEPLTKYVDARVRTGSQAWSAGHAVSITNHNGGLTVDVDSSLQGTVLASGTAFTLDGASDADQAKARLQMTADPSVVADASGDITIDAPGGGNSGYDLIVHLPPDFDGALKIDNQNGNVTLHGANNTKSTVLTTPDDITADNLVNSINLISKVGDINVSALPSGQGNVIQTDLGDINARIGQANLMITATTAQPGTVTFPSQWPMQSISSDRASGTATIGDGTGALTVTTKNGNIAFAP